MAIWAYMLRDKGLFMRDRREEMLSISSCYVLVFFNNWSGLGKPSSANSSSPLPTRLFQETDLRESVLVGYPFLSASASEELLKQCVMLGGERSILGRVFMDSRGLRDRFWLAHNGETRSEPEPAWTWQSLQIWLPQGLSAHAVILLELLCWTLIRDKQ